MHDLHTCMHIRYIYIYVYIHIMFYTYRMFLICTYIHGQSLQLCFGNSWVNLDPKNDDWRVAHPRW